MYRRRPPKTFAVGEHDFDTSGDLFIGGRPLLNNYYDGALDELSLIRVHSARRMRSTPRVATASAR